MKQKNAISTQEDLDEFLREAEIMMNMKPHANVTSLLGFTKDPLCLVTEFAPLGSLDSILGIDTKPNEPKPILEMNLKLRWMCDIAAGMYHISLEKIVHKDLASRNVLIGDNMIAKVSDFGLARFSHSSSKNNSLISMREEGLPLKWLAPESLLERKYSTKSDVWSFGVTLIEILTQNRPYPDLESTQAAIRVSRGDLRPEAPPGTLSTIMDLVTMCNNFDPEKRPDFKEICDILASLK